MQKLKSIKYLANVSSSVKEIIKKDDLLFEKGDYKSSLEIWENYLKITTFKNEDDLDLLYVNYRIGKMLNLLSQYSKSIEILQKSLTLLEPHDEKRFKCAIYDKIAINFISLSNYKKGETYMENCKELLSSMEEDDYQYYEYYTTLSNLKFIKGFLEEAFKYTEKAKAILEKYKTPQDIKFLEIKLKICKFHCKRGEFPKAKIELDNLLKDFSIKKYGKHPSFLDYYSINGWIYYYDHKLEESKNSYIQKYETLIDIFGKNHSKVSDVLINLGETYRVQGNLKLSENSFDEALKIMDKIFEKNHIAFSVCYNNLGSLNFSKKDYDKALEFYEKAVKIKIEYYDGETFELGVNYYNVGLIYSLKKDFEKALFYYEKALPLYVNSNNTQHPNYLKCVFGLSQAYLQKGETRLSLKYLLQIVRTSNDQIIEIKHSIAKAIETMNFIYLQNNRLYNEFPNKLRALQLNLSFQNNPHLIRLLKNSAKGVDQGRDQMKIMYTEI